MKKHKLVRSRPVARFYYKGSHSHPVKRTVLIIESNEDYIKGYEVREGKTTRKVANAPIKSYKKNRIARFKNLRREKRLCINRKDIKISTLRRTVLSDFLFTGP